MLVPSHSNFKIVLIGMERVEKREIKRETEGQRDRETEKGRISAQTKRPTSMIVKADLPLAARE